MNPQFIFEAIGTHWVIDIHKSTPQEQEGALFRSIMERIDTFDRAYSRFRADSLVTRMSQEAGVYTMPDDFDSMITLYQHMYEVTHGLMTPLIGQLLSDAGYDKDYSLIQKNGDLTSPLNWSDALEWNKPLLTIKKPILLDFGAAGKGYLVDLVARVIEAHAITSYTIDAGGDIYHRGPQIRIGLEHPEDQTQAIGVATITDQAICGSSGNRRKWGAFHHIINPESRSSPLHILSIWVVASSTLVADALTTALFFTDARNLSAYEFEYVILKADFSIEKSAHFPGELFIA
jgi:FAD:protein FMN transferase